MNALVCDLRSAGTSITITDEMIEAGAEVIWNKLSGITHDGVDWNHVSMRRYDGSSMARDHVLAIARTVLEAALLTIGNK